MKKFSKKSVVLFAAMALCALAVPSMASAATWAPNNTAHTLHSTNLGFTAHGATGTIGSSCATSTFTSDVSSAFITVTAATFTNCTGTLAAQTCAVGATATRLPWRATPLAANNVTIDGVHIDVRFSGAQCAVNGLTSTLTGNLGGGDFSNVSHHLTLVNDLGLTSHSALGNAVATVSGTVRDVQQTLVLN